MQILQIILLIKMKTAESVLSKDEEEKLKELFKVEIPELHVTVEVKGLSPDAPPVIATRPEFMRRMKDMAAMAVAAWEVFMATCPMK